MSSGKCWPSCLGLNVLRSLVNIGSSNELVPVWLQAITWNSYANLLSIKP